MFPQPNPGKPCSFPSSSKQLPASQKHLSDFTKGIFLISQRKTKSLLFLSCLIIFITNLHPASAHNVKIAADVGGTLHIEPNDNPRAGETSQAWFALTRKGGKAIPLSQCNCQLAVYAEPHAAGEPALIEPSLKPVTAERYQGIPGAEIIFPKPGLYQLQLKGKPTSVASFKPFNFKFQVTVASGTAQNPQNIQNVNSDIEQNESQQLPIWAIALPIMAVIGLLFVVLQNTRRS